MKYDELQKELFLLNLQATKTTDDKQLMEIKIKINNVKKQIVEILREREKRKSKMEIEKEKKEREKKRVQLKKEKDNLELRKNAILEMAEKRGR